MNILGKIVDGVHQLFSSSYRAKRATEELFDACYHGTFSEEKLKKLLKRGADINARNPLDSNKTPCMLVARHGNADTLEMLIKNGAKINQKDEYGRTECMLAAMGGRNDNIRVLAKHNANLDEQDEKGDTACMIAVSNKHIETAKVLADELNANLNIRNNDGDTVCAQFADLGYDDLIFEWIKTGRITCVDKKAFIKMAANGRTDIVNAFVGVGSVDIQTKNEACKKAASNGRTDTVDVLVKMDIDDVAKDAAFIEAASNGYTDTVILLHHSGVHPNARDNDNVTACIRAAQNGHTETVTVLVKDLGEDINIVGGTMWHRSACLAAVRNKYYDTVLAVAELGGDIYKRDKDGLSTVDYLKYYGVPVDEVVNAAGKYKAEHPDANNGNTKEKLVRIPLPPKNTYGTH